MSVPEIDSSPPDLTIYDIPDKDRAEPEEDSIFEKYRDQLGRLFEKHLAGIITYFLISAHIGFAIHWIQKKRLIEVSPPLPPIPFPLGTTQTTQAPRPPDGPVTIPITASTTTIRIDPGAAIVPAPILPPGPSAYSLLYRNAPIQDALNLFRNLGYRNLGWLGWNARFMSGLGNRIEVTSPIHPLVLLATLYKDNALQPNDPYNPERLPPCRSTLRDVYNDTIKWHQFINGLRRGMTRERNNVLSHVPEFTRDLGRNDANAIYALIQSNNLQGLFELLFL